MKELKMPCGCTYTMLVTREGICDVCKEKLEELDPVAETVMEHLEALGKGHIH